MRALLISLATLALLAGCEDLGEFRTDSDQAYRGAVVGADATGDFIRRGFPATTRLELAYDPHAPDGIAGTMTTYDEPCTVDGDCACVRPPTLTDAELVVIPPLVHDQISLYDFPGGGRLRNFIYAVRDDDGPLAARDALAFVSLMRGGRVEVRIVAGTGARQCAPDDCAAFAVGDCDYFGIFELERESR